MTDLELRVKEDKKPSNYYNTNSTQLSFITMYKLTYKTSKIALGYLTLKQLFLEGDIYQRYESITNDLQTFGTYAIPSILIAGAVVKYLFKEEKEHNAD